METAGFAVTEAANGVQATEVARAVGPVLVLLDVQLPDIDGFEVARQITACNDRPIVVLTSTREASDYGERLTSSPAAGFLPKDQLSGVALRDYVAANRS